MACEARAMQGYGTHLKKGPIETGKRPVATLRAGQPWKQAA
jgi:hypothetical protein